MATLQELGLGNIGDRVRLPTYDVDGNRTGIHDARIAGWLHVNGVCVVPPASDLNLFVQRKNPSGPPKFRPASVSLIEANDSLFLRPESRECPPTNTDERLVQAFAPDRTDYIPANWYQFIRSSIASMPRKLREQLYTFERNIDYWAFISFK